jgi:hypothetical protein
MIKRYFIKDYRNTFILARVMLVYGESNPFWSVIGA